MRSLFILLLAATGIFGCFSVRGQTEADYILAIVNGSVITSRQVDEAIRPEIALLIRTSRDRDELTKKVDQLHGERLKDLIDQQLILFDFKDSGYQLPEPIVDDVVNERIKQRFGSREVFAKSLQQEGKTFEAYRQEQRDGIIIEALRHKNISSEKVLVSPQRIQRYYNEHQEKYKLDDQVKLRMIALNVTPANPIEEIRSLATEILAKIDQGAPFAEMASVYSEGSYRGQGGERGWVERTSLRKELSDAAFSLKPGQHSGLIEVPQACYILLVEEARPAHVKPLTDIEVRDEIETTLQLQERNRIQEKWMTRVKKKAYVKYFYQ